MLIVNAFISYHYERKARPSLSLPQQRLVVQTRVLGDGEWKLLSVYELAVW